MRDRRGFAAVVVAADAQLVFHFPNIVERPVRRVAQRRGQAGCPLAAVLPHIIEQKLDLLMRGCASIRTARYCYGIEIVFGMKSLERNKNQRQQYG